MTKKPKARLEKRRGYDHAQREKRRAGGLSPMTVWLPSETVAHVNKMARAAGTSRDEYVNGLLKPGKTKPQSTPKKPVQAIEITDLFD